MEHTLNEKLAIIQAELKAHKSQLNKFGNYNTEVLTILQRL